MHKKSPIYFGVLAALVLAGCAVSQKDISEMKDAKTKASEAQLKKAATQLKQEGSLTRMSGNFLGDTPIELPYAATLPAIFFENISIKQKGSNYGTVAQAAKNVSLATGLPVSVNPDVEMIISAGAQAGQSGASANLPPPSLIPPNGAGVSLETPLPMPTLSGGSGASVTQSQIATSKQSVIRLDYHGQLLNYLNQVASSGGINWEYREGGIHFFRMVTKFFTLSNIAPGQVTVTDGMSKGGVASTGQTGGQATNSGSFNSSSSVTMSGSYSMWKDLKTSLDAAKSNAGKIVINEGTGTVTVTDTKEAVYRIQKIIDHENELLGRQVAVDIRVIKVALADKTQAGLDLNAIYTSVAGNTLTLAAPGTNTTALAGSMTFKVGDVNSKFYGSSPALQALNKFGTIVSDTTKTLITTNRMPAMTGAFATEGFLASTTPATGGGTSGGTGVPGLTPGSATTGSFLRVTPTIKNNNTVLMSLSIDLSSLVGIGSASTGSGQTLQQIQWANTEGTKSTSNLLINQNEAMVMLGVGDEGVSSAASNSITGGSASASKTKDLFVIIVTPRILRGI